MKILVVPWTVCPTRPHSMHRGAFKLPRQKKSATYLKENQSRTDLGVHLYSMFKTKRVPNVSVSL
jgi:hypothetical protein